MTLSSLCLGKFPRNSWKLFGFGCGLFLPSTRRRATKAEGGRESATEGFPHCIGLNSITTPLHIAAAPSSASIHPCMVGGWWGFLRGLLPNDLDQRMPILCSTLRDHQPHSANPIIQIKSDNQPLPDQYLWSDRPPLPHSPRSTECVVSLSRRIVVWRFLVIRNPYERTPLL